MKRKLLKIVLKAKGTTKYMYILTNRRLVIIYLDAEENYPFGKITAVKVIFKRSRKMVIIGIILAFYLTFLDEAKIHFVSLKKEIFEMFNSLR